MDNKKHNGYSNRSTFLAVLWLQNHEPVYGKVKEIAKRYRDMLAYWDDIKKRDSSSYSYPFNQHKGIEKDIRELIQSTPITAEQEYGIYNVNIAEVLKAIEDN